MDVKGTAAIVAGGASGLGSATASALAAAGAQVTIIDMNAEAGQRVADAIGGIFIATDVTVEASVADALSRAEAKHGVARVLVNCAGIAPALRLIGRDGKPHSFDAFRRTIDVNLLGSFNTLSQFATRLAGTHMIGEERGIIINTASVAAFDGQIGQAAYAASKAAIAGLTLPAARDLAQHRIRVMTIAPGLFLTPMLRGLPQPAQDSLATQCLHPPRLGHPDEYAQMVMSIIANPMLNGEVIRLDGAIRLAPR
jgi:NAD(P)-dependent dehydrogenase (short-subunit alcohol dehydrogenase family)